ncbi:MAG: hypothetical protein JSV44_02620, partial [Candidatus Zixiibacteriota bacterium]
IARRTPAMPSRWRFGYKSLMVLQSALCFGTHIFIIIIFALWGKPHYALVFIGTFMNLYLAFVLYLRKRKYMTWAVQPSGIRQFGNQITRD